MKAGVKDSTTKLRAYVKAHEGTLASKILIRVVSLSSRINYKLVPHFAILFIYLAIRCSSFHSSLTYSTATAKEGKSLADSFAAFDQRTKEHTELSVLGGVLKTCCEFQTTIQDLEGRLNGTLAKDVAEPLNAGRSSLSVDVLSL